MQTSLSKFLNAIFKYLTIFLLSFVWLNFYVNPLWVSVLISVILTIIIGIILELINKKKQTSITLKNKEKKIINECTYQFLFADKTCINNFFISMLKNRYNVEEIKGNIIVTHNQQKTLFSPLYHTTNLSTEDIISTYLTAKSLGLNNIIITCKAFSNEAQDLASSVKDVKINLLDENLSYKFILKPFNVFPNFSIELKNVEKLKYKEITNIAFNKSKSKNYFLSGILLMFSSFFTPYNIYYLITASILFIMALYSSVNKTHNKIDEKDLF